MSLQEKVAREREKKAEACERKAVEHDSYGPSQWGRQYREDAKLWRLGAEAARAGDLSPIDFTTRNIQPGI